MTGLQKMQRSFQRSIWPEDTAERLIRAREIKVPWVDIAADFGCSVETVRRKAADLGIFVPRRLRYFTPEEDAVIRSDYTNNADLKVTAEKLGRTYGDIRQRLFHHHHDLLRSGRTPSGTKALQRFGSELLEHGATPHEAAVAVKAKFVAAKAAARVAAINAKNARRDRLLTELKTQIAAGKDRNIAIFEARAAGLGLQEIANCFDITRERIRQICDATAFKIASEITRNEPLREWQVVDGGKVA